MRTDVYREKEIELMVKHNFEKYLKLMANSEIPTKNKLTLLMYKIDEFVEEAKQEILNKAVKENAGKRGYHEL